MKELLIQSLTGLVITLALLGHANAEFPSDTGERLAQETMGLVAFAEMGNIGARDPECKGTPFPVADISSLIQTEIAPIIDVMKRAEPNSNPAKIDEALEVLKAFPSKKNGGIGVIQGIYDQKKQEARIAYGAAGACAAMSAMVQTVIQQKRLALRGINTLLASTKPD